MTSIADRVKKILVEHLGVDPERVTPEASIIDDLGGDSLDTLEIVMAVEDEFSVEVPDDALDELVTVGDLIAWLGEAGAR